MGKLIYGVDIDSPITPLMVRDAIIECFWSAHCQNTELDTEHKDPSQSYCKSIIEKIFKDNGWDFENPDKIAILGTLKSLAEFSKNFRDPSIIQGHFNEIMELVNRMK